MARDVLKVSVGTQEFGTEIEAHLGDDAVDCPANGDSLLTQNPEKSRRPDVAVNRRLNRGQGHKNSPGALKARLGPEPLQNLSDDDRKDGQIFLVLKGCVEASHMRSRNPVEEVGPRVGVDDDHPRVVRADLDPATRRSR